jgi:hypothetical protein
VEGSVYTPGAGHAPPVLAGRERLLRHWELVLAEVPVTGRVRAEDIVFSGPRGIGKTATMLAFGDLARRQGFEVVNLQAVQGQGTLMESLLQEANRRVEEAAPAWKRAARAIQRLGGVSVGGLGVSGSVSLHDAPAAARSVTAESLAAALANLAAEVQRDAPLGGVMLTVDELQVGAAPDIALLAAALHRLNVDHPKASVLFAASGLPHVAQVVSDAGVTHPDRLFVFEPLPLTLSPEAAVYAVVEPARRVGVLWEEAAVDAVVTAANGYPAHIQLFAHAAWREAAGPRINTAAEAARAIPETIASLGRRTFAPRWNRLTGRQRELLAALALLGGEATAADLIRVLDRPAKAWSAVRDTLIKEGDIYAPRRGELAVAVPAFADFVLDSYSARPQGKTPLAALGDMRRRAGLESPHAILNPSPAQGRQREGSWISDQDSSLRSE